MKRAIVFGAGGFIGGHLILRLKEMNYFVRGVDIKYPDYRDSCADEFIIADLRDQSSVYTVIDNSIDEIYQLAADMGGAEYIFSGLNDAEIMKNSILINLNVLDVCVKKQCMNIKIFYSSSACIYPQNNQIDTNNPNCVENSAYPANPDSEYGWEKIFSERLYQTYARNKGFIVKIARFHNIFGPYGTWNGGREKAPAAICRKIANASNGDSIDIFGDGEQTRSFLYIDECIDGIMKLMSSTFDGPINIGSDEMISINTLVKYVADIAGKTIIINHIPGPLGVRGRNSDNSLIELKLQWKPTLPLNYGLKTTYQWICKQVCASKVVCSTDSEIESAHLNK